MDAKFFDGLFEGDSPNGVRLGMGLTAGDFWPRPTGCQNLYRGQDLEAVDFDNILATADCSQQHIAPPAHLAHEPGASYYYVLRRVNICGDEEHTFAAIALVGFDEAGLLASPACNRVFDVRARQLAGGVVELVWFYWPIEQPAACGCFKVYGDNGTGQVNYEQPLAQIPYAGRRYYTWRTGELLAGRYLFCIRAAAKNGPEDGFLGEVRIDVCTAEPQGPVSVEVKTL
jgi:hypothetical protein